jgi:hypothetical protein
MTELRRGAVLFLACLAMLPPQPAGAQDRTPTPSAEELREAYPLRPSRTPGAERTAAPSGTGSGSTPQPADRAPAAPERDPPIALLAILAFVAALGVLALPPLRRRLQASTSPAHETGLQLPEAEPDPRANGHAPEPAPTIAPSAILVPPDPHRRWTATIEWHQADTAAHFSVVARAGRGAPATVLADSGPVEWPPMTPTSVQALGAAAAQLEASLVAAGWKALAPGHEWYAKRFAWEPVAEDASRSPAGKRSRSKRFARRAG